MSALVYILSRSFKNIIKGLIRKPAALIAYVIIAGFILLPSIFSKSVQEPVTAGMSMDAARSIFMGYTVFLLLVSTTASLSGASFFRMADVNLLFTAPLKAGYILIYGYIKQLATNLAIMLFLALQYPNWKRTFGFIDGAGWILMLAYFLLITITSFLGMLLYAYVSKKPGRRSGARMIISGLIVVFLMPIIVNIFITGDVLKSIVAWLSNDYLKFVPIIGWFREILMGVFLGLNMEISIYILLTLLTSFIAFIFIYKMDTGFYENVLSGTELKEKMLEASRKGKTVKAGSGRRYRKVTVRFTVEGSLAIFQKQILEKRKRGFWLLPLRTILMTLGAVLASLSIPADSMELMLGILSIAAYLMLIMNVAAAWESEISYHYVYLIPEKPFSKMLAATLAGVINMFVEGLLIFGLVGIILRIYPLITISVIAAYAALGIVFVYSDLVVRRLFGKIHGNVLRIFFRIFLLFTISVIAVVPAVLTYLFTESYALAFLASTLINMILTLLFMWVGTGLFRSPELS